MIKLSKYLKPFIIGLVLAIVLLFGQAMCDLNLPNFMSDIVNVGIQQNGIEHAAPDAITPDGIKMMNTFMTDSEKQLVANDYMLVSGTDLNADGEAYAGVYPKAGAQLYVKKELGEAGEADLDNVFGTATWTLINVMKDMAAQSDQTDAEPSSDLMDIDLATLYQAQPMLDMLPQAAVTAAHEKALVNDETILMQSGIMLSKAFYDELGADINGIQTAYILRIGLRMLAIALLGGLATVSVSFISSKIAAGVARNLRKDMFNKIESFSNNEFDKFSTASLITRCSNDITQIQQLLMIGIRMICYAPIMGIGGIIMAVNKSSSMSWIIAAACVVLVGLILVIMSIAMPKFK
ncbi:MAG: ABC transporter transmembrane domain-containing protein, partial [Acetanaerobacterium sp.]